MIRSMTGFGRGITTLDERKYTVEIKTVNHRYNDISIRMPRFLIGLEGRLRQLIAKNVSRGKIDVFVTVESLSANSKNVKVDEALAGAYILEMRKLIDLYKLNDDISATSVLRLPDVIVASDEVDEDTYWNELSGCAQEAINNLNSAREVEGESLKTDLKARLIEISDKIVDVEEKSLGLVDEYKNKLEARLEELGGKGIIDDSRLGMELVLFADKSSIVEEVTRLRSHITSFDNFLSQKEDVPCGKKLDFLLQEMNREINTIGSKANCLDITNSVVYIKNEIENIREQVQNIE